MLHAPTIVNAVLNIADGNNPEVKDYAVLSVMLENGISNELAKDLDREMRIQNISRPDWQAKRAIAYKAARVWASGGETKILS